MLNVSRNPIPIRAINDPLRRSIIQHGEIFLVAIFV